MEEKDYKKLKNLRIVAVSGWIVAVVMAILFVFNLGDSAQTTTGDFSPLGGQGAGRGFMSVSNLLDNNGQVDYQAIEQFKVNIPSEHLGMMLDRMEDMLDLAVSNGEITQAQATSIYNAFK